MAVTALHPVAAAKRVWTSPGALDGMLLAGADPRASARLQRRAQMLARKRRRERMARAFERAIRESEAPRPSFSASIPVQRSKVLANRTLLRELASMIRRADAEHPAGLIVARRLLTDGNGPLFAPSSPGALRDAVDEAVLALTDARPRFR